MRKEYSSERGEMSNKLKIKKYRKGCAIGFIIGFFVLIILVLLSIRDFTRFKAKARSSNVKQNLGAIFSFFDHDLASTFSAQKKYHQDHDVYASHTSDKKCFELLGWKPSRGHIAYSYYCDTDKLQNNIEKSCPEPEIIPVSADSFTIVAVGNIDSDPTCDVWTINDDEVIKHIVNDVLK